MSPNRAERRHLERAAKKTQRKEEKRAMKAASNSSRYNAKKSQKIAPHLQTDKTEQGGLNTTFVNKRFNSVPEMSASTLPQTASLPKTENCSIKMKYAKCMGNIVADTFRGRELISKYAYHRITSMTYNEYLDFVHASNTSIIIEDRLLSGIDTTIQESLLMTDFSADHFMNLMRNIVDSIVTDAIVKIMGAVINDRKFVRDVLAFNVFKDINNMFAKAIYIAIKHVYYRSMEDDTFYDDIDCDDMYDDAFFDDFTADYYNYYKKHHLTPEMVLRQMMEHAGDYYFNNEYYEKYNTNDEIGHAYIEELDEDDDNGELDKDDYINDEHGEGVHIDGSDEEDYTGEEEHNDTADEVDEDYHISGEDGDTQTDQEDRVNLTNVQRDPVHDVDIKVKKSDIELDEIYAAAINALCNIDISNNDDLTIKDKSKEQ